MEDWILGAVLVTFAVLVVYSIYVEEAYRKRLERLRPRNAVLSHKASIRLSHPSRPTRRWRKALLFVSNKHIVVYGTHRGDTPLFTCLGHEIEGFWRPRKYEDGINSIEIHANAGGQWTILKVRLTKSRMMALVRALKDLVDDDIERSYRQRRPYIYRPPAPAHLAHQDIYGMWSLDEPITVYLTPATLVFMDADDSVRRVVRLRHMQNIRISKHADADSGEGLVSFYLTTSKEDIAFAVKDYEAWAQSIATAARRTLEEPVTRKRKGKARVDDDSDWDNDPFDMELWESQEYILGDDGELEPRRLRL